MRDLTKEFTIPNGVNSLNATASLDPFFGPFVSVAEAYDLVPENKRAVGKIFAIYLDSTRSNINLYYWITNSAGAEWRPIPLLPHFDTDRVISLGAITVDGSVVTIGLPSGGANMVEIRNQIYSRYESISFTTDAIIVAGNFRKDIIEARADSTVFYLKKGVESINPVPPALTEGALFISEVLVTSTGVSAGALNSVVTDSTMKGDGTSQNPLGLSASKNAEINGKISKQGINLGNTGNIPEMKTGDISGIYRGHGASNPVYEWSPFLQMVTADTFAQIHTNYKNGEMAYRAGNADIGYSPIRISWDNVNLVNPATQTWVNKNYLQADSAVYAGFVVGDRERPYIRHSDNTVVELATNAWVTTQTTPATQAEVEASTGTHDKPTSSEPATENRKFLSLFNFFKLIKNLRYIHLLPNSATAFANRLRSDGSRLFYANNSAIESTVAYTSDLDTVINYRPTGDFTMSQLKTIVENAGLKFKGIHIIIVLDTNNYTLNIDNGSTNINSLVTIGKRGTGTLNFTSSRTLTATDSITIMNGNEGSMSKIDFGTSADILTIRNL